MVGCVSDGETEVERGWAGSGGEAKLEEKQVSASLFLPCPHLLQESPGLERWKDAPPSQGWSWDQERVGCHGSKWMEQRAYQADGPVSGG